jgi:hypothetical protein
LNDQVLANKVGGIKIVGENASDFGSGKKDVVGTFLLEETTHGHRVCEIEFGVRCCDRSPSPPDHGARLRR